MKQVKGEIDIYKEYRGRK